MYLKKDYGTTTNDQISYGMKHFLGNLDVEAISKGEHPDFSGLAKLGMLIRGALNKKLAEGLKFTTGVNNWLTKHYYEFPETPDGFEKWQTELHQKLVESNEKLGTYAN